MSQNFIENNPLIGESPAFFELLEKTSRLAKLEKPILIIGERGTGKELVAMRLHYLSKRWSKKYLKLNCATLTETLLDSELFGHEAGSFTGATKKHIGRFEMANDGSLFLDEIATTSLRLQEKLLRVIEYGEFERVGSNTTQHSNARIIAATNIDLPDLALKGLFRHDLLDRISFDVITIPPLRYRENDILTLANHFAINMSKELDYKLFDGFENSVKDLLINYEWPGNVRELKNVIERAVYLNEGKGKIKKIQIDPFESPYRPIPAKTLNHQDTPLPLPKKETVAATNEPYDLYNKVNQFEIKLIKDALNKNQQNQRKTAEYLNLTYNQLRGLINKYKLINEKAK